jgi:hypothetical protein
MAGCVTLSNLFGMGLTSEGAKIRIRELADPLLVGDACCSLRSLAALTALRYVFAAFLLRRGIAASQALETTIEFPIVPLSVILYP